MQTQAGHGTSPDDHSGAPLPFVASGVTGPTVAPGDISPGSRVASNAVWLAIGEGGVRVLTLLSFAVVSRVVGPDAIGHLTVAAALILYASVLGDGGLTTLTQRRLAAGTAEADTAASATTVVQLCLAVLASGLVAALLATAPFQVAVGGLVVAYLPFLLMQALNLNYVLQARERMPSVAGVRITTQLVTAIVTVTLVVLTGQVVWAVVGMWVGLGAGNLMCLALLLRQRMFRPVVVDVATLLPLVRDGLPFLGIAFLGQMFVNLDVIVVGLTLPSEVTGYYGAAIRFWQVEFIAMGVVAAAAFPQLSRRYLVDRTGFDTLLQGLVVFTGRCAMAASGLIVLAAPLIVGLLLGPDYQPAGPILGLLGLQLPLGFYQIIVGTALVAGNCQRDYLAAMAAVGLLFVGLLLVLTPQYGMVGAALAVVCRDAVMVLVVSAIVARRFGGGHLLVDWLRQIPYLIIPLAAGGVAGRIYPPASPWMPILAWAIATATIEGFNRGSTVRRVTSLARRRN